MDMFHLLPSCWRMALMKLPPNLQSWAGHCAGAPRGLVCALARRQGGDGTEALLMRITCAIDVRYENADRKQANCVGGSAHEEHRQI